MWRLAAGARAVADFRFDDRIEGTAGLFCLEAGNPARQDRDVTCARARKHFAGATFDELVQWMVEDASLDR
jgi:D-alanine-D-alanine ligase